MNRPPIPAPEKNPNVPVYDVGGIVRRGLIPRVHLNPLITIRFWELVAAIVVGQAIIKVGTFFLFHSRA